MYDLRPQRLIAFHTRYDKELAKQVVKGEKIVKYFDPSSIEGWDQKMDKSKLTLFQNAFVNVQRQLWKNASNKDQVKRLWKEQYKRYARVYHELFGVQPPLDAYGKEEDELLEELEYEYEKEHGGFVEDEGKNLDEYLGYDNICVRRVGEQDIITSESCDSDDDCDDGSQCKSRGLRYLYKQLIEDFEQEDEYDDDIFEEKKDLLTSNKDILNAIRGHLHEMRSNFEVPAEVGVLTKGQINEQSGELDEDDTYGFVTNWDEEKNTFTISYLSGDLTGIDENDVPEKTLSAMIKLANATRLLGDTKVKLKRFSDRPNAEEWGSSEFQDLFDEYFPFFDDNRNIAFKNDSLPRMMQAMTLEERVNMMSTFRNHTELNVEDIAAVQRRILKPIREGGTGTKHPWTADPFHQLGGFENAFTTFQGKKQ